MKWQSEMYIIFCSFIKCVCAKNEIFPNKYNIICGIFPKYLQKIKKINNTFQHKLSILHGSTVYNLLSTWTMNKMWFKVNWLTFLTFYRKFYLNRKTKGPWATLLTWETVPILKHNSAKLILYHCINEEKKSIWRLNWCFVPSLVEIGAVVLEKK